MIYLLIFVFVLYYLLLLTLIAGWNLAIQKTAHPAGTKGNRLISVLVPFRNEEKHLPALIAALRSQDYQNFEVLLIDDHSEDQGPRLARDLASNDDFIRIISSPGTGKKPALTAGVEAAKGGILVTTDADCIPGPNWLSCFGETFADQNVRFAFGPVGIDGGTTLFSRIQQMEFATVMGTGASAFALGFPIYCNGANLGFTKSTFKSVDGYAGNSHIASGDDEFLLKKVNAMYPGSIRFLNTSQATVLTSPQEDVLSLVRQRLRWAGKWRYSGGLVSAILPILFVIVQVAVSIVWVLILKDWQRQAMLYLLFGKALLEFILIFMVLNFTREKIRLMPFVFLQLVYPFYLLGIGFFSRFTAYTWKGRRWKNTL